jgi:DNA-directed RNA polymerase subunit RPC12/RpoP
MTIICFRCGSELKPSKKIDKERAEKLKSLRGNMIEDREYRCPKCDKKNAKDHS